MDRYFDETAVEILEQATLHREWMRVDRFRLRHRRFAGGWTPAIEREILIRGEIAVVLPYDPVREELVMIEQFRLPTFVGGGDAWQVEPVAGMVDPGEDSLAAARRELVEEAGLEAGALTKVCRYFPSPGGSTQVVDLYVAQVDASEAGGLFGMEQEDEDIRVVTLPLAEAFALLDAGRFEGGPTLIALLWLARHRERLRRAWLGEAAGIGPVAGPEAGK